MVTYDIIKKYQYLKDKIIKDFPEVESVGMYELKEGNVLHMLVVIIHRQRVEIILDSKKSYAALYKDFKKQIKEVLIGYEGKV